MRADLDERLIEFLFAMELRRAHFGEADIADILKCHERAHERSQSSVYLLPPETSSTK